MTSRHSLYKSETKMKNATEVQLVSSVLQRKINDLKLKVTSAYIIINMYREMIRNQSKFDEVLREHFLETYESVKKIFLEKYGSSPRRKELKIREISKIKNQSRGQFLIPRLCKQFNINMEDIK